MLEGPYEFCIGLATRGLYVTGYLDPRLKMGLIQYNGAEVA